MRIFILMSLCLFFFSINAQSERSIARKANKLYNDSLYVDSEVMYKKSLTNNNSFDEAKFNLSDALFKQNRYDESIKLLKEVVNNSSDSLLKSEAYFNLGNNYLQKQELEEAINSYKNSLLINPKDEEARYNLAKSISLLKDQQNENNKDKQDQNQKNDEKDQQNSGQTDGNDENEEKKQNPQNNQENSQQNSNSQSTDDESGEEEAFEQQKNENKLSEEDMRRILEALDREEKKVQEKMKKSNLSNKKIKTDKDW